MNTTALTFKLFCATMGILVVASGYGMAADYLQREDFGVKQPGDTVGFTAHPPGKVLTGRADEPGGFAWFGGPATWDGTIPDNFAGLHCGLFSGTFQPAGSGGGGSGGSPHTNTWEVDTSAQVAKDAKIRIMIKNFTKTTYDGLDSDGRFECKVLPASYHASAYRWKYGFYSPGQNNPDVTFANPKGEATTISKSHWYAAKGSPTDYSTTVYLILCEATVDGTVYVSQEPELYRVAVYNPAGYCERPACASMDFSYSKDKGKYMVTGITSWKRNNAVPHNLYTPDSQFHEKVAVHEQQNQADYDNGFDGHVFYSQEEFAPLIIGLSASNLAQLQKAVHQKFTDYSAAEEAEIDSLRGDMEDRAYALSDEIPPTFAYQRGGAGI